MKTSSILTWILRLVPAVIMLQTLFFKFTGAPESIYIFETLGLGDAGRYGTGVVELVASVLLLIPKTTWMGAVLALGTMAGAILGHLTQLGIEVKGDGGALFGMAIITFICCAVLVWLDRSQVPVLKQLFAKGI